MEDDLYIATQLAKEFGFKFVVNHGLDIFRALPFEDPRKLNIPLIYGPLDSHPYKVELKHEYFSQWFHFFWELLLFVQKLFCLDRLGEIFTQ